jgi:16S rRNA pseudouridine516 synthase
MPKERLDKILVSQGLGSRKEVQAMIRRGAVEVEGTIVRAVDHKVDPEQETVTCNGAPLDFRRFVYFMLHKPAGVVSASRDPKEPTVVDLMPEQARRRDLFPAGRLDKDTTGLLIITDDGDYAHRMLTPKNGVCKYYHARLRQPITPEDVRVFGEGVTFADGTVCLAAGLRTLEEGEHPLVEVCIHEGKYHQVKKMSLARGNEVLQLKRVRIGNLSLDPNLAPGEYRLLSKEETEQVFLG